MPKRFAFMGFRHGHIVSLYQHALKHDDRVLPSDHQAAWGSAP